MQLTALGVDVDRISPQLISLADPRGEDLIARTETTRCEVCGEPLLSHERCRGCRILLGPGHVESEAFGGYCSTCLIDAPRRRRQRGSNRVV